MNPQLFANKIIDWYQVNKRDLPWRNTLDPYQIWLSEIILQQTRVNQGLPYYQAFTKKYPTVFDLSSADEQDVLRTWQGLGYYSRARNLHKCAKIISSEYDGKFPNNYSELLKLPGIGPYTAAAIASFAFREKQAVVDGNVYRVLARVYGIHDDIASNSGQKEFQKLAQKLISVEHPDLYNQGIMEFGAMHCTPKSPDCHTCIFTDQCIASKENLQRTLPVKIKKTKVQLRYFYYFNIMFNDQLLMKKRNGQGIWEGLYDFMLHESPKPQEHSELIDSNPSLSVLKPIIEEINFSKEYLHILSHRKIKATFIQININQKADITLFDNLGFSFFTLDEIHELPKPVLISHYLNDTFF